MRLYTCTTEEMGATVPPPTSPSPLLLMPVAVDNLHLHVHYYEAKNCVHEQNYIHICICIVGKVDGHGYKGN